MAARVVEIADEASSIVLDLFTGILHAVGADEVVAEPTGGRRNGVLCAVRAVVLAAFDALLRLGRALDAHVVVAPGAMFRNRAERYSAHSRPIAS
jgi:hypothetical protein